MLDQTLENIISCFEHINDDIEYYKIVALHETDCTFVDMRFF